AGYRGLLEVAKGATGAKSKVVCDALILDEDSRSDTYPYIKIDEDNVDIGHEATVSKIGEEQRFYLMSRGLSESEASAMIVSGFVEPITKELPLEYAVEMNRLIQLQMEGSVGGASSRRSTQSAFLREIGNGRGGSTSRRSASARTSTRRRSSGPATRASGSGWRRRGARSSQRSRARACIRAWTTSMPRAPSWRRRASSSSARPSRTACAAWRP